MQIPAAEGRKILFSFFLVSPTAIFISLQHKRKERGEKFCLCIMYLVCSFFRLFCMQSPHLPIGQFPLPRRRWGELFDKQTYLSVRNRSHNWVITRWARVPAISLITTLWLTFSGQHWQSVGSRDRCQLSMSFAEMSPLAAVWRRLSIMFGAMNGRILKTDILWMVADALFYVRHVFWNWKKEDAPPKSENRLIAGEKWTVLKMGRQGLTPHESNSHHSKRERKKEKDVRPFKPFFSLVHYPPYSKLQILQQHENIFLTPKEHQMNKTTIYPTYFCKSQMMEGRKKGIFSFSSSQETRDTEKEKKDKKERSFVRRQFRRLCCKFHPSCLSSALTMKYRPCSWRWKVRAEKDIFFLRKRHSTN